MPKARRTAGKTYWHKMEESCEDIDVRARHVEGAFALKFMMHVILEPPAESLNTANVANVDDDREEVKVPHRNAIMFPICEPISCSERYKSLLDHPDTDPELLAEHQKAEKLIQSKAIGRAQSLYHSTKGELVAEEFKPDRPEVPQPNKKKVKKAWYNRDVTDQVIQEHRDKAGMEKIKPARLAGLRRMAAIEKARGDLVDDHDDEDLLLKQTLAEAGLDGLEEDDEDDDEEQDEDSDDGEEAPLKSRPKKSKKPVKKPAEPEEDDGKTKKATPINTFFASEAHPRVMSAMLRGFIEPDPSKAAKAYPKPLLESTQLAFLCQKLSLPTIEHALNRHLNTCMATPNSIVERYQSQTELIKVIKGFCCLLTEPKSPNATKRKTTRDRLMNDVTLKKWFADAGTHTAEHTMHTFVTQLEDNMLDRIGRVGDLDNLQIEIVDSILKAGELPSLPYLVGPKEAWEDFAKKTATNIVTAAKEDIQACVRRHAMRRIGEIGPDDIGFLEIRKAMKYMLNMLERLALTEPIANFFADESANFDAVDVNKQIIRALRLGSASASDKQLRPVVDAVREKILIPMLQERDQYVYTEATADLVPKELIKNDPLKLLGWRYMMLKDNNKSAKAVIVSPSVSDV